MAYPPGTLATDLLNETDAETGVDDAAGLEAEGGTPGEGEHAERHNLAAEAVNDVVGELGANPSGASATVQARLEAIDTSITGKASKSEVGVVAAAVVTEKERAETAEGGKASKGEVTTEKERAETAEGGKLAKSANLSDVASATTSRTNLGLGSMAVKSTSEFAPASHTHAVTDITGPGSAFIVRKSADQNLTKESTTLQDVTGLDIPIGSSSTEEWQAIFWLHLEAPSATPDYKLGFSSPEGAALPTGLTGRWGGLGGTSVQVGAVAAGTIPIAALAITETFGFGTRGGITIAPIVVFLWGGGTSGTVRLRASQNTSDPGQVTILKRSFVRVEKIAT